MDKGRQPNMWSHYDISRVNQEAFERCELQRRIQEVREIISNSDAQEKIKIDRLGERHSFATRLDLILGIKAGYLLSGNSVDFWDVATAKIFDPHETTSSEDSGFSMEYHTSVVAFDLFDKNAEEMTKAADVLLFRLSASMPGEPEPKTAARDMVWGGDCVLGAIVTNSDIRWFSLGMTGGEIVEGEVRREDITEESGEKVEMRFMRKQKPMSEMRFIDPRENSALVSELNEELDKFIASRQSKPSS